MSIAASLNNFLTLLLGGFVQLWGLFIALQCFESLITLGLAVAAKRTGRTAKKLYKFEPLDIDHADASSKFPMVLVQIPMFNEKEVYKISISAVCQLAWPVDRLRVQVLDDSSDLTIKELVREECEKWSKTGIHIEHVTRSHRDGYKAGSLVEGMTKSYVDECEFLAMFDADFQPQPDFLLGTIPYLLHNPRLATATVVWGFVNPSENLISRCHVISNNKLFRLLSIVGSAFFGVTPFFGTGGVWRMKALKDAGGWSSRTLIEDFDLWTRCSIKGWQSVLIDDIVIKSEIPKQYGIVHFQQKRLAAGWAELLKTLIPEIVLSKTAPLKTRVYFAWPVLSVTVYSVITRFVYTFIVVPAVLLVPAIQVHPVVLFGPFLMAFLTILDTTPEYWRYSVESYVYDNILAAVRMKAGLLTLFNISVPEWVVTQKIGNSAAAKFVFQKAVISNIVLGSYLLLCAMSAVAGRLWLLQAFMYLQSAAFIASGLNLV